MKKFVLEMNLLINKLKKYTYLFLFLFGYFFFFFLKRF